MSKIGINAYHTEPYIRLTSSNVASNILWISCQQYYN